MMGNIRLGLFVMLMMLGVTGSGMAVAAGANAGDLRRIKVKGTLKTKPTTTKTPPQDKKNAAEQKRTQAEPAGYPPQIIWPSAKLKEIATLEKKITTAKGRFFIETKNWHIETEINPRFTAELAVFMEEAYVVIMKTLGLKPRWVAPVKPTVVIFANVKNFRALKLTSSGGLFKAEHQFKVMDIGRHRGRLNIQYKTFHLYTFAYNKRQYAFPYFSRSVLLHEGAHAILARYVGAVDLPAFLNEGFASYAERLKMPWEDHTVATQEKGHYRKQILSRALWQTPGILPPLDHALNLPRKSFGGRLSMLYYALGESFIDTLMLLDEGPPTLRAMLDDVRAANAEHVRQKLRRQEISVHRARKIILTWQAHPPRIKAADNLEPLWHAYLKSLLPNNGGVDSRPSRRRVTGIGIPVSAGAPKVRGGVNRLR